MSVFGDLLSRGIESHKNQYTIFDQPIIVNGGIFGGMGKGKVYYVDAVNGDDGRSGLSPQKALKTLLAAYNKCTADQHDTVVLLGSDTTFTIEDQLEWAKDFTHLIGIAAPTPNSRARITNSGNSTSGNALLKISAQGCRFENFRIYQGSATATCYAVDVTGNRNFFLNVNIQGQIDTASAQAPSASLRLNGAEEFRFVNCIIGQVTGAARTAGYVLLLDTSAGKGDFINCDFLSYSETAGAEIIGYADAAAVDRSIIFRECLFYNFSVNHATLLTEVIDMPSSPQTHDMIFFNPSLVGISEMVSGGAANEAFVWVVGGTPAAGTAGSGQTGVAVHPS